jgi:hypothetical protein
MNALHMTMIDFAAIAAQVDSQLTQRGYLLTWSFQRLRMDGRENEEAYVTLTASKGWGGSVAKVGRQYCAKALDCRLGMAGSIDDAAALIIEDLFPNVLR